MTFGDARRFPQPRRMRAPALLGLGMLMLALTQCTSGTEPDHLPGSLTYRLLSPNGSEGAVLFSAPASEVVGVPEGDAFTEVITHQAGGLLYVAVVHRVGADPLTFELDVANTAAPPDLTLLEVAGPDDRARSLGGYAIEVLR